NLWRLARGREQARNHNRLCVGLRPKRCEHALQYQLGLCRHVTYGRLLGGKPARKNLSAAVVLTTCSNGTRGVRGMMKSLFLQAPSFDGFDGGAGARYQMSREVRSFWYPTWLAQPAALVEGSKLIDAPPHRLKFE